MKKSRFKVIRRRTIFSKGPIRLLDCTIRMPGGKSISRQVLDHTDAVVILPRKSRGRYLLIRQFRFAAGGWLWEFPAGGVERGEPLKKAAVRELMEETGFKPGRLSKIDARRVGRSDAP